MATDEQKVKNRERNRLWREANPEAYRDAQRRFREKHRERRNAENAARMRRSRKSDPAKHAAVNERWRARNREKVNAAERARYARNPTKKLASCMRYKRGNPEKAAAIVQAWAKRNPESRRATEAKRKHRARTPAWANHEKIKAFYDEAARITKETGVPHEVDHIYPLNGRRCSGLHVETNLQVLTQAANRKKSNRAPV